MVRALSREAEPCCPAVPWANGTQINMIRSLDPPAERSEGTYRGARFTGLSTVHGHVDNISTRDPRGARRVTNPSDFKNSGAPETVLRPSVPASSTQHSCFRFESHTLG